MWFFDWLMSWRRNHDREPQRGHRINIPRSILAELRGATTPRRGRPEPLAFLRTRFASEFATDVLVGIGVIAFAEDAYVAGDAGANFDTLWAMNVANAEIHANVGLLLAHSHGGPGRPTFSSVDRATNADVMIPFSFGVPHAPYGAIVLSDDDATAVVVAGKSLQPGRVYSVADWGSQWDSRA
jgi:hypothetical protein